MMLIIHLRGKFYEISSLPVGCPGGSTGRIPGLPVGSPGGFTVGISGKLKSGFGSCLKFNLDSGVVCWTLRLFEVQSTSNLDSGII